MFNYFSKAFFLDMFFLNWLYGGNSSRRLEVILLIILGETSWLAIIGPKIVSFLAELGRSKRYGALGGLRISLVGFFIFSFLSL